MSARNNKDSFEKEQSMYRRTMIVCGAQGAFFGILTLRLLYLQIWQYRKYLGLSAFNKYRISFVPAKRGSILDRNDVPVAYSRVAYRALFDPTVVKNKESIMRDFFQLVPSGVNAENFIKDQMKRIKIYNSYTPLVLNPDLKYEEIARIEFNIEYMPGVWIEKSTTRVYPFKQHTANITGYISKPTPAQMASAEGIERRLFKDSSFKIGQIGMELIEENALRGKFGITLKEVNASGDLLNQINHMQPQDGKNIKLTIDTRLQSFISETLNGVAGSIIVSDVKTGDIMAMQSSPCLDPNDMLKGVSDEMWKKLNDPKLGYMSNKAIYGNYSPGSTFKSVTVLAGLMAGFDPNRTIECTGTYQYGNRTFHCHKKEGHGRLNMVEALACSCNVYLYNIGNFIDISHINHIASLLGLGQPVNLGIGKESYGLVPTPEWKMKNKKEKWLPSETIMVGIGQSYLQVTLMQLNNMITKIASGFSSPNRIIFSDNKDIIRTKINIPEEHLDLVRKGLRLAFTHRYGTSGSAIEYQKKYEMAGKTGTAQVISKRFTIKEMLSGNVPKHHFPHGLYTGYAPYSDPKFSVTAMIEHSMTGVAALRYAEKAIAKAVELYQ